MKIQTLTIRYAAKRSAAYQSAEVGAEMTVQIEDGDKICDVFAAGQKKLRPLADKEADAVIRTLVDDDRRMKGF